MTMGVSGYAATPQVSPGQGVIGTNAGGATNGLLPPPPANGEVGAEEAVTMLLQMSSQMSEQQMRLGKAGIDVAGKRRDDAANRRKEALDRAAEAARQANEKKDGGGMFDFVTDHIGVVGLVGLCTFQWGLVAADVAAHHTGLADKSTNLVEVGAALYGGPLAYLAMEKAKDLAPEEMSQMRVAGALAGGGMGYALMAAVEKLAPGDCQKFIEDKTAVNDDDLRVANKVALIVALAAVAATCTVLSCGTTTPAIVALVGVGISTTTQVAADTGALKEVVGEKAAAWVALSGAVVGTLMTLGASAASWASATNTVTKLATAKQVISAVNGARMAGEGVYNVKRGVNALERAEYQHDADLANVDAEDQKHVLARIEKIVDAILEDLKEAHESTQRSTETLQETLQTKNQTMLQAGAIKV